MEKRTRMKIAIVGDYPLDEQRIDGGVQAVMVNLVHCLAKNYDLEIHILAPKKGIRSDSSLNKGSIHYHFFPKCTPYELSFILGVNKRKLFKQLLQIKPALVHIQNYEYSYLCKNSPYPTIVTPHGMPQLEARYRYGTLSRLRTWLHGTISERFIVKYAKNLILISEYGKSMTNTSNQTNLFLIPNPVRSDFFLLKNREVKNRLFYLVSDVTPRKNPLMLLKAVAALKKDFPEISLHLAGYFSNNEFLNLLKTFINQNQIENNVKFTGPLDDDRVMEEYEECAIFVLTSEWENLPVVIAQAMAAGKAIVATRVGGVPEMIQDGVSGLLVSPGDLDALTKRLETVLRDGDLREKLGNKAKEEAFKRFRGEIIAKKTYQVYQSVVRQHLP